MIDTVVVGARCAGAPLAMLLARAGQRVALVDRAGFPSDTLSTHFLWPRGVARLAGWGLLEPLKARGCEPIPEITFDVGPVRLRGTGGPVDGITDAYCPRRTVLDALLVEHAIDAGAELIDGFLVENLLWSDGRVAGVTGHHRGSSRTTTIAAQFVVGADGLRSTIAAQVDARAYRHTDPLTCVYYAYWSSVPDVVATFYARPGQLVLTWPTNDELTCIYVAWPAQEFATVRSDVAGAFRAAVARIPELAERLACGRQESPLRGTRNLPNFFRASEGPGWALAGDAGHHKDPCTGMGMSDAFLSADLLARCLSGDGETRRTLGDYQRKRDSATADTHELTLKTARLTPPSARLQDLYRAAADQPDVARRVFEILGGIRPIAHLYAPEPVPMAADDD